VFKNWRVEAFDTPAIGAAFMFGGDFGFAVDPSVLVRCWIARQEGGRYIPDTNGRFLMIDQEAYRVGCDVDFTPALFGGDTVAGPNNAWRNQNPFGFPGIPEATRWPIIADSARPETISYLQRHGFPQVKAAKKGPGSVEEGIEFLKAYTIVIHPRCEHTQREFTVYSFKIDQKTGLVLPVLVDKENHVIDSVRYAVEDVRRGRGFFG
jgi:phage terminase large subunit